jgi:Domain of unknown function (DUF4129)
MISRAIVWLLLLPALTGVGQAVRVSKPSASGVLCFASTDDAERPTSNVQHPPSNEGKLVRSTFAGRWLLFAVRLPLLAAADNDKAVRQGGDILGRGMVGRTHPFYDSQTDDVRLIPPPQPSTSSSFSFDGTFFGYLMLAVVVIVLVLILIFFLRRLRDAQNSPLTQAAAARSMSDVDRIEALPFRVQAGLGDLLSQAAELYRQGRFAEAILLLFSYLLVEMDKHQVIRLAKGKTNRQYLREIGPRRRLRDLVERTMTAFEAVFFGHHGLDREGFEACWSEVAEFQRLVDPERREEGNRRGGEAT